MTGLLGISFVVACGSSSDETTSSVASSSVQSNAPTTAVSTSLTTTSTLPPTTSLPDPTSTVLFDFSNQDATSDWFNQNDTVMGGVSDSATTWVDEQLVFSGNLSLDNNGGFTSTFGPINDQLPTLMSGAEAIVVTAPECPMRFCMGVTGLRLSHLRTMPSSCPERRRASPRGAGGERRVPSELRTGEPAPWPGTVVVLQMGLPEGKATAT